MKTCKKVKNPCKICLSPVSQKNGLQCQGTCGCWIHFSCLNYTPGKIQDIKAGIIKVTCPCPDCKTIYPKEYRTDEHYHCNNTQCPAKRPPTCQHMSCPMNFERGINEDRIEPTPLLGQCGPDCKKYSIPQIPNIMPPHVGPTCIPQYPQPYSTTDFAYTDSSFSSNTCPSGCSSQFDISGDFSAYSALGNANLTSSNAVEQMCNTVGQLSNKINKLMVQMKHVVNNNNSPKVQYNSQQPQNTPYSQPGPGNLCPKSCYCPENPKKRK